MQTNINNKIEWIRNFFFVSRKNGADKIGVTAKTYGTISAGAGIPAACLCACTHRHSGEGEWGLMLPAG